MNKVKLLSFILLFIISSAFAKESTTKPFCSTQILAKKISGGYTWTLATRLGYFLKKAEKMYGTRDKTWTILGTEFSAEGQPQIWYPFSTKKTKFITIQLTRNAAQNKKRMLFQLAHETIHLLSPHGPNNKSSVFEEGLATYFSIHGLKGTGVNIAPAYIASKKYTQAYVLVAKLHQLHSDTAERIKDLRSKGETLSKIKKEKLMAVFPKIDAAMANLLTQRFDHLK